MFQRKRNITDAAELSEILLQSQKNRVLSGKELLSNRIQNNSMHEIVSASLEYRMENIDILLLYTAICNVVWLHVQCQQEKLRKTNVTTHKQMISTLITDNAHTA